MVVTSWSGPKLTGLKDWDHFQHFDWPQQDSRDTGIPRSDSFPQNPPVTLTSTHLKRQPYTWNFELFSPLGH